ncbi:MAG: CRISPR-associated endonuclease Cas2 [Anaerovoracaceae bacterium]
MERMNYEPVAERDVDPQKKLILIIYDITDNKARGKFVKLMESFGFRVQKSAFEALVTKRMYKKVIEEIPRFVSPKDNVRVYKLNNSNELYTWGDVHSGFDEEVIII